MQNKNFDACPFTHISGIYVFRIIDIIHKDLFFVQSYYLFTLELSTVTGTLSTFQHEIEVSS